jgi:hypothetical protein
MGTYLGGLRFFPLHVHTLFEPRDVLTSLPNLFILSCLDFGLEPKVKVGRDN